MEQLAGAVVETAGQPATVRVGTILSVNPMQVDISTTILNSDAVGCVASYQPRTGDTVVLIGQSVDGDETSGSTWMIVGACVNSGSGEHSHNGIQIVAPAIANNTGVFADITGLVFPFTKRRDSSVIHSHMAMSSYSSAASAGAEYSTRIISYATGVGVAVAEQVIAAGFWNAALTHLCWTGFGDIPNVPAGSYFIQARYRLYIGAAFIQMNADDRMSFFCDEM